LQLKYKYKFIDKYLFYYSGSNYLIQKCVTDSKHTQDFDDKRVDNISNNNKESIIEGFNSVAQDFKEKLTDSYVHKCSEKELKEEVLINEDKFLEEKNEDNFGNSSVSTRIEDTKSGLIPDVIHIPKNDGFVFG
jgi:CRISPR/Cas system CMR subunit Cmr4 (Cas7 group RAMP superfamily)